MYVPDNSATPRIHSEPRTKFQKKIQQSPTNFPGPAFVALVLRFGWTELRQIWGGPGGRLTVLVKTIVNTNNNTLAKSIADTNTNTAVEKYCQLPILFTVYYIQQRSFFRRSSTNNVNRMTVVEKLAKSL